MTQLLLQRVEEKEAYFQQKTNVLKVEERDKKRFIDIALARSFVNVPRLPTVTMRKM